MVQDFGRCPKALRLVGNEPVQRRLSVYEYMISLLDTNNYTNSEAEDIMP